MARLGTDLSAPALVGTGAVFGAAIPAAVRFISGSPSVAVLGSVVAGTGSMILFLGSALGGSPTEGNLLYASVGGLVGSLAVGWFSLAAATTDIL